MTVIGSTFGLLSNCSRPLVGPRSSLRMPSSRRLQLQFGDGEQVLGRIRQQAEAVDHLHLQFAQPVARRARS